MSFTKINFLSYLLQPLQWLINVFLSRCDIKKQNVFLTYYFFLQLLSTLYLLLSNHYPILKDNHGISEALAYNQVRLISNCDVLRDLVLCVQFKKREKHHGGVLLLVTLKKTFKKNFMAPFYGWGSTASRIQPLRGGSLLFTIQFPEIPGTHFVDIGRMKG